MKRKFEEKSAYYRNLIECYFDEQCFQHKELPQKILFESMRYSLLACGKRIRPILVFEFASLCGLEPRKAIPFAAAVEMIHTYSLIHDDLPCMDNDDYRRGRLTNHKVYGEAMAVLSGDALLTAAFSQIANAELSAEARISAVGVLSECAGELGMVGGQVLDMMSEDRACSEREVLDIQERKTGALIRAACLLGVIAAQGNDEMLEAANLFASNLGLAFQIRDDMLDVIGDASILGKATGVDGCKNTFVRLYGIEKCDALVNQYTNDAITAVRCFDDSEYLKYIAYQLTNRIS